MSDNKENKINLILEEIKVLKNNNGISNNALFQTSFRNIYYENLNRHFKFVKTHNTEIEYDFTIPIISNTLNYLNNFKYTNGVNSSSFINILLQ